MASGSFRLNSRFFDEDRLTLNKHRLSQTEQVSYPTLLKYIYQKGKNGDYDVRMFSGDVLFAILSKGMGYTLDEIRELRFGDVFEIVEEATK